MLLRGEMSPWHGKEGSEGTENVTLCPENIRETQSDGGNLGRGVTPPETERGV